MRVKYFVGVAMKMYIWIVIAACTIFSTGGAYV